MLTPADRARWSAPFPMGFYYYRRTAAGLVWREGFAIETVHFLQRKYEPDSRCLVNFDSQCYCGDPSGGLSAPGSSVSRCVRTPMQKMVGHDNICHIYTYIHTYLHAYYYHLPNSTYIQTYIYIHWWIETCAHVSSKPASTNA